MPPRPFRHHPSPDGHERGAAVVEFAILLPVLLLVLCGILDFGLMFAGHYSMENATDIGARTAAVNQYSYGGSCTIGNGSTGVTTATAQLVCSIAATTGSLTGTSGNLSVGVCFVNVGATPSCNGQTASGTSITQDVEVCSQITMHSSTGVIGPFMNGKIESSSSRLVIEAPQPSGSATAYGPFNLGDSVVMGSKTVNGMNCS